MYPCMSVIIDDNHDIWLICYSCIIRALQIDTLKCQHIPNIYYTLVSSVWELNCRRRAVSNLFRVWLILPVFRPGYEYIYRYESHVLSGIPAVSSQFGGVKINAVVKMQFNGGEGVTLKVRCHIDLYLISTYNINLLRNRFKRSHCTPAIY